MTILTSLTGCCIALSPFDFGLIAVGAANDGEGILKAYVIAIHDPCQQIAVSSVNNFTFLKSL